MRYASGLFALAILLLLPAAGARWLARHGRGTSAWRTCALKTTLALIGLVAPLLLAEGWFYFFVDATDSGMLTLSSRRWADRHLPPPNTFRGRQGPSPDAAVRPTLHMAVLGDSITYGQGIERDTDLYPTLLEHELRARGIAIDVYNSSFFGWDTARELSVVRQEFDDGARFRLVVLGFCLNDIGAVVPVPPDYARAAERFSSPPAVLAALIRRSFVASFLYNRYVTLASPESKRAWESLIASYRSPGSFADLVRELTTLKRLVESHGSELVVLTFPDLTAPWESYPHRDIHRKLDDFWRELGVTHLDLLTVFEKYPPGKLHASFMDSHPNELAHRLAAAALADVVEARLRLARVP